MKLFLKIITIIGPMLIVPVLLRLANIRSGQNANESNVLRLPRISRIVSALCFVVFFGLGIYILIFKFKEYWQVALALMLFWALPSLIMFIMCLLWKVVIKDTSFVYRNFFGKKVEYQYNELTYKQHPKGLKWYFYKNDKKVFCMAYYVPNGDALYKRYKGSIKKQRT